MNQAQQHSLPGAKFEISDFPCRKAINLFTSDPADPTLIIELSTENIVTGARGRGAGFDYLNSHDPATFSRNIANRVRGSSTPPRRPALMCHQLCSSLTRPRRLSPCNCPPGDLAGGLLAQLGRDPAPQRHRRDHAGFHNHATDDLRRHG